MVNGWTLERRRKQSELIHKWQPWKESTGARTEQGKGVSKMNALKHGFYSFESLNRLKQVKVFLIKLQQLI